MTVSGERMSFPELSWAQEQDSDAHIFTTSIQYRPEVLTTGRQKKWKAPTLEEKKLNNMILQKKTMLKFPQEKIVRDFKEFIKVQDMNLTCKTQ